MTFEPAPFPSNEERRVEIVDKIDLVGDHHDDLFYNYCELGKVLSGFDRAAVTIMTSDKQCSLATSDGSRMDHARKDSICQYAILKSEPTIVYKLSEHPVFRNQRNVVSGELIGSFCAFPIINKNNYALGTFCLANENPIKLSENAIGNLKALVERLAFQLDTYIDQTELTAEKIFRFIKIFRKFDKNLNLDDLQSFLALICERPLNEKQKSALLKAGLIKDGTASKPFGMSYDAVLLKREMGLSTVPMKRQKVDGSDANDLISELFKNLSDL